MKTDTIKNDTMKNKNINQLDKLLNKFNEIQQNEIEHTEKGEFRLGSEAQQKEFRQNNKTEQTEFNKGEKVEFHQDENIKFQEKLI